MITKFEEVFDKIKSHPKKQIAVAVAHDSTVLEAVTMAEELISQIIYWWVMKKKY